MSVSDLIQQYAAGPELLRATVAGMSREELLARPVPGKWSTMEVIAHMADTEPLYAERIKRVVCEDQPTLFALDPDTYVAKLPYQQRDLETELTFIEATRRHMLPLLLALSPADFERTGRHSADGPLTAATLLQRIVGHIPHHIAFIREKRAAIARG